ncbi:MAG: RNA polymerase factor sigma-54 [Prevotella sp.]|nr:RNA polymerase factor sigma-54 [Prevotella sp.]
MPSKQIQKQTQQQKAKQRLTPQQVLVGQMIEKPIDQLTEYVNQQMHENPALEESNDNSWENEAGMTADSTPTDDPHGYDDDDYLPVYSTGRRMEPTDMVSFYDKLKEQMMELELDERQRFIMEYLIGSLDSDGLLRKRIDTISDEMAIYHNFDASTEEIGEVLRSLQTFDPPGVGACDLRECLLLQVERKKDERMREILTRIIGDYFDDLLKNHWDKLQRVLHLTDEEKTEARQEIRKLNPRPGSALGEVMGFNIHQITPDFIVETNDDGQVTFTLNRGRMPALEVSESYIESLDNMKALSRRERDAIPSLRRDIDKAKGLIDAIQQRQNTLKKTMAAIIRRQYRFFLDGDEADLHPMTLKDIASDTGLDISTISRVTNEKYAETRWGIFRLRFFFTDKIDIDGEEVSTRKLKILLQEIIDGEDKSHPLTDMQIEQAMKEKGFPIARRTIVKYREQLGIPKSTLRKQ